MPIPFYTAYRSELDKRFQSEALARWSGWLGHSQPNACLGPLPGILC